MTLSNRIFNRRESDKARFEFPKICLSSIKNIKSNFMNSLKAKTPPLLQIIRSINASKDSAINSLPNQYFRSDENSAAWNNRILLLQGPVGPFFSELCAALTSQQYTVKHVLFNAGDQFFSTQNSCTRFSGNETEWEKWLSFELSQNRPDMIILFGALRPAHKIARKISTAYAVPVLSLEEGYLRSGYITCELGGNNQHSPLANWKPSNHVSKDANPKLANLVASSFFTMSYWGVLYYLIRDTFSSKLDDALFHRVRERPISLSSRWFTHTLRRFFARALENRPIKNLSSNNPYTLVPLQIANDSQLLMGSRGWDTDKMIHACLRGLSRSDVNQRIVFKLHPLDPSGATAKVKIHQHAKQLGIASGRVRVLHTGRIGDLTRNANGMVVINSTSAFSALHHNIPLLVLGDAVYRHEEIVTLAETAADVERFFEFRRAMNRGRIDAFFSDLKSQSLLRGDFYAKEGRRVAIKEIIAKQQRLRAVALSLGVT
jgi:capsular polysaccharide export protein